MKLTVNGQDKDSAAATLTELVSGLCANSAHVIAEVNGQIVKSRDWAATALKDGDRIELVSFVGGG